MSELTLAVSLMGLAFLGSALMSGRRIHGRGLPSGAEYFVLGVIVGPHLLGLVQRPAMVSLEPLFATGAAWIALLAGIEYGRVGERRVGLRGVALGLAFSLLTALLIGLAVYYVATQIAGVSPSSALVVAGGAGIVSCETAKQTSHWIAERHGAGGPLQALFADAAVADDAVPLLGTAWLFTLAAPSHELGWPTAGAALATVTIGVVLGLVATLLLRAEEDAHDGSGVLLGAALLATGTAWRFGWSSPSALFVMGISLSLFSRHAPALRGILERTEQPVLLPTVAAAGALLSLQVSSKQLAIVAVAALLRLVLRPLAGVALARTAGVSNTFSTLGLGMLSTGSLTLVLGLAIALRFPGEAGRLVLLIAATNALLGEFFGPAALGRALARAPRTEGELAPARDAGTPANEATPRPHEEAHA